MRSILDVEISCFKNYKTPQNPKSVNLLVWLKSNKYEDVQQKIRILETKSQKDSEKSKLPAITPSGMFSYRGEGYLIKHSGLIQIDIDPTKYNSEIYNYKDLKQQVCNIPNIAYFGLSVSGTGYWGLIPISNPERHKEHFNALYVTFKKMGIELDEKPKNVASLRGYAFDSDAYFNHNAKVFTGLISESEYLSFKKGVEDKKKVSTKKINNSTQRTENNPLNVCISIIENATVGEKYTKLLRASALAGGFISKGLLTQCNAESELVNAILKKDIECEETAKKAINDGIKYGMNNPVDLLIECCFVPFQKIINYSDKSFQIYQSNKFTFLPKSQVFEINKNGCYVRKYYLENNDSEVQPKYVESNSMNFESQSVLNYSFVQSKTYNDI
jgi:hypothetical protein